MLAKAKKADPHDELGLEREGLDTARAPALIRVAWSDNGIPYSGDFGHSSTSVTELVQTITVAIGRPGDSGTAHFMLKPSVGLAGFEPTTP